MWIPFTQLLLPPPTGRMRDFSQQVKQQAAGKSNSRLASASERALAGGSERQDGSAILSSNFCSSGKKLNLLETEAEAGAMELELWTGVGVGSAALALAWLCLRVCSELLGALVAARLLIIMLNYTLDGSTFII
ncbi:uncharacterized protein LOC120284353 [Drosophila simulans]|uniref:uncharacterized protein LOC120284353 n=1 Tax=Drosophila simulans TaxID=7240 RepID=UPI00192D0ECB|nr:uncharacterized protein LOC120284353 [Drosophila simulans]